MVGTLDLFSFICGVVFLIKKENENDINNENIYNYIHLKNSTNLEFKSEIILNYEDNLLQATNSVRRENGLKPLTSKDLKELATMYDKINNFYNEW